jgi:transcription initiation factor TFIIH subunit 1
LNCLVRTSILSDLVVDITTFSLKSCVDEQFWKKYLESAFFQRDRGRLGIAARNAAAALKGGGGGLEVDLDGETAKEGDANKPNKANNVSTTKENAGTNKHSEEEQEARAAAVAADDMFSRYEQKLLHAGYNRSGSTQATDESEAMRGGVDQADGVGGTDGVHSLPRSHKQWGQHLAVGQFDLVSTHATERGRLLEGPRDHHPANAADPDGRGSRVIRKYNRHWALVLHPDEAIAGRNLLEIARRSVTQVLPGDPDANASGGVTEELTALVASANRYQKQQLYQQGVSDVGVDMNSEDDDADDEGYGKLTLSNVEAYYTNPHVEKQKSHETAEQFAQRHSMFAKTLSTKAQAMAREADPSLESSRSDAEKSTVSSSTTLSSKSYPSARLGRDLLSALTKKMAQDSKTEAASLAMVDALSQEFRDRLHGFFRRSSELLRHFYVLRRLQHEQEQREKNRIGDDRRVRASTSADKLSRIVKGLETLYRELETMRKDLAATGSGESSKEEIMRKMCLPIMDQLDWAFKLHREASSSGDTSNAGGGGGFVAIEQL